MRPLLEWTVLHSFCFQTNGPHMVFPHMCSSSGRRWVCVCLAWTFQGHLTAKKRKDKRQRSHSRKNQVKTIFFLKQTHTPFAYNDSHDTCRPIEVSSGSASLNPRSPLPIRRRRIKSQEASCSKTSRFLISKWRPVSRGSSQETPTEESSLKKKRNIFSRESKSHG